MRRIEENSNKIKEQSSRIKFKFLFVFVYSIIGGLIQEGKGKKEKVYKVLTYS